MEYINKKVHGLQKWIAGCGPFFFYFKLNHTYCIYNIENLGGKRDGLHFRQRSNDGINGTDDG